MNIKEIKDTKSTYIRVPDTLINNYDYEHLVVLGKIASLSFSSGYCNASNKKLLSDIKNLTKHKLNRSLDWLEEHSLINRYNQLNMVNEEFFRTKRVIVLSEYCYSVYKSIDANNKIHKPIKCPKGFLSHDDYLDRTKGRNNGKKIKVDSQQAFRII